MYSVEFKGYTVVFSDKDSERKLSCSKNAVALGNFDGVHVAHQELIRKAIEMRRDGDCELSGAWTFSKNPLEYFVPDPPRAICTPKRKAEILLSLGLDFVVLADFGFFKDVPSDEFCDYLKRDIGAAGVVCGYNYRFGRGGQGDPAVLASAFGEDNTYVVGEVDYDGRPVSSTRIRGLVESGDMVTASKLLGRDFSLIAKVVSGKRLGRSLGFPTANQYFEDGILVPKCGIYATKCIVDGKAYVGVTNVGVRPTVEDSKTVNAETYILDFSGDIYDKTIEVGFVKYLRDEMKFSSVDELGNAIARDAMAARMTVKI